MSAGLTILICRCANAHTLPEEAVSQAVAQAERLAGKALVVDDLCELAQHREGQLALLGKVTVVLACAPRAVRWLLKWAGAELPAETKLVNLRQSVPGSPVSGSAPLAVAQAKPENLVANAATTVPTPHVAQAPSAVRPQAWFPVIDYDACINCKQCLGFCLFGVYTLDAQGRVAVTSPQKCKNNCPACARVCPATAVIFPKYKAGPINGEPAAEVAAVDLQSAMAGDVMEALRRRGQPDGDSRGTAALGCAPHPQLQQFLDRAEQARKSGIIARQAGKDISEKGEHGKQ